MKTICDEIIFIPTVAFFLENKSPKNTTRFKYKFVFADLNFAKYLPKIKIEKQKDHQKSNHTCPNGAFGDKTY
jgi:hypothetical protein